MRSSMGAATPSRFRHVIFPGALPRATGPLNYAPAGTVRDNSAAPVPDRTAHLSADESAFLHWLFAAAGLCASRYKPETLRRRLPACLRAVRATNLSHARSILSRAPHLRPAAVSALVIGVTQFFRDAPVFAALNTSTLAELASHHGRLRVWSAGCSDGAELYSFAILLAEAGLLKRCELLGTDCRPDAVERARAGVFDADAVRAVPADLRRRYFVVEPGGWRVTDALRDAATWRAADLLSGGEPGAWDVVLCRNLLIYLTPQGAGEAWAELAAAVRPGGVLVLGKAERPPCPRRFAPVGPCVYRRSGVADVG